MSTRVVTLRLELPVFEAWRLRAEREGVSVGSLLRRELTGMVEPVEPSASEPPERPAWEKSDSFVVVEEPAEVVKIPAGQSPQLVRECMHAWRSSSFGRPVCSKCGGVKE